METVNELLKLFMRQARRERTVIEPFVPHAAKVAARHAGAARRKGDFSSAPTRHAEINDHE